MMMDFIPLKAKNSGGKTFFAGQENHMFVNVLLCMKCYTYVYIYICTYLYTMYCYVLPRSTIYYILCITMYLSFGVCVCVFVCGGVPMRLIDSQGMFLFFGAPSVEQPRDSFHGELDYEVQDGNMVLVTQLT